MELRLGVNRLVLVTQLLLESLLVFFEIPIAWILNMLLHRRDNVRHRLVLGWMLDSLAGRELGLFWIMLLGSGGWCSQRLVLWGTYSTCPWIERCRHPGPSHETRWSEPRLLEGGGGAGIWLQASQV